VSAISAQQIEEFSRHGVVVLRGVFDDWIESLRRGVETNMRNPGPWGRDYLDENQRGRFFGDYCNWDRIDEYRQFMFESPAAEIAADLMQSDSVRIFHEHVLVKEPGTDKITPWHHDQPYYCVDGRQVCSMWIPLDEVGQETCPEFVAGSHDWGRWFLPRKFSGIDYQESRADARYRRPPRGLRYPQLVAATRRRDRFSLHDHPRCAVQPVRQAPPSRIRRALAGGRRSIRAALR
jgi:ectoine hydroxylase-related dioxygenase (phytanoyl-CoA dioxygenase family)